MQTVLDSIRVVEMTEALAGPIAPPLLGEHTGEILRGLGYSPEDARIMATEAAT